MRTGMPQRIPVAVCAEDPLSRAGMESQLRHRLEVLLCDVGDEQTRVVVVVSEHLGDETLSTVKALRHRGARVLLIASSFDDDFLVAAIGAGVTSLVRRAEATP